jgi:uncharacterized Zn finger protein
MSFFWRPYVPVAQRRADAARQMAKLAKNGHKVSPVRIQGRTIAKTFWGKAWCDNLESYSDYENRMPRGRTYVRNGSVVDLQIEKGKITARVSGSSLYKIQINITPLSPDRWKRLQSACGGKIDSLIELLQGKLSSGVMGIVTHPDNGLFPKPAEISFDCSCPDVADMCKHLAATLYGVGSRLDSEPELLFFMRGVDPADLITTVSASQAIRQTDAAPGKSAIAESDLSAVFGIDIDTPTLPQQAEPLKKQKRASKTAGKSRKSVKTRPKRKRSRMAHLKKRDNANGG